jgi:tetratricopeptide (TPR) repeat protein
MAESPLRVEQALRLLPDVDALTPLRAFLIAMSRRGEQADAWDTGEPYRTVGRRFLKLGDLRRRIPEALERAQAHLASLYEAVLQALEAEQGGNMPEAVRALLRAGASEEGTGRYQQAQAWYTHALGLAEGLRDRRPEIEALCALGRLAIAAGRAQGGAREYQRALALAEAELDQDGSIEACQGLGDVAAALGTWTGAESWYTRGLRLADGDPRRSAELLHRLARAASQRGEQDLALERLRRARDAHEAASGPLEIAGVLHTQGDIELRRGRAADAITAFREASTYVRRAGGNAPLDVAIWLGSARALMELGRWREAEDECRRGEEVAIAHNLTRPLARLYTTLGSLRGAQNDAEGFVFFEKAIELCRGLEPNPRQEGDTYLEYARFRRALNERDEARACYERALEIFNGLGYAAGRQVAQAELDALPPP